MAAPAKATQFLLGSAYSSPASVAHGGTAVNTSALDMRTFFDACLNWWVTYPGSPGTVAVTLQPQVSDDNSHWTNDGNAFLALIPSGGGVVTGTYLPPVSAMYSRMQLVNADTGVDATAVVTAMATETVA